ncbi:MAG: hypothetical protein WHZ52_14545 [Armatimonadota bacterium]
MNSITDVPHNRDPGHPGGDSSVDVRLQGVGVNEIGFPVCGEPRDAAGVVQEAGQAKQMTDPRRTESSLADLPDVRVKLQNVRLYPCLLHSGNEGPVLP